MNQILYFIKKKCIPSQKNKKYGIILFLTVPSSFIQENATGTKEEFRNCEETAIFPLCVWVKHIKELCHLVA